jgi:hypothetical protein
MAPLTAGPPTTVDIAVPALGTGAALALPPSITVPPTPATTAAPGAAPPTTAATPAATAPTITPTTTPTATTVDTSAGKALIDALGPVLGASIGVGEDGFAQPDVACVDAAVAALDPSARGAVDQLIAEPSLFDSVDDDLAEAIALAYVGCVDDGSLRESLIMVTGADEFMPCLAASWPAIEPEAIAASFARGHGLNDLPAGVVDVMTMITATCVPDRQWWIDDEALQLVQRGFDPLRASCIASAVVDAFGVGPVIKRRVLTLELYYPVDLDELDRLDLRERCDAALPRLPHLDAPPGTCLAGLGPAPGEAVAVACEEPHNAEVVSLVDLGAEYPVWPGVEVLVAAAGPRCLAELQAAGADLEAHGAASDLPGRAYWEQGLRLLTCALVRPGLASWSGPAGPIPPVAPPVTTTTA